MKRKDWNEGKEKHSIKWDFPYVVCLHDKYIVEWYGKVMVAVDEKIVDGENMYNCLLDTGSSILINKEAVFRIPKADEYVLHMMEGFRIEAVKRSEAMRKIPETLIPMLNRIMENHEEG